MRPEQGATLPLAQKSVQPLFSSPAEPAPSALSVPERPITPAIRQLTLKPDAPPKPRHDIRGLDWYDECDADHFLGRDDDADRVIAKLLSNPILRLVGPSGIGKSSFIRAGLLPRMRNIWLAGLCDPPV
jgi:hypothetical protein